MELSLATFAFIVAAVLVADALFCGLLWAIDRVRARHYEREHQNDFIIPPEIYEGEVKEMPAHEAAELLVPRW